MSVLYVMLPVALLLAAAAVTAFIWASRSGQLDDVDTPPHRMLFDDMPLRTEEAVASDSQPTAD